MGATVEFYIAKADALGGAPEPYELLLEQPRADFNLHLLIPEDLDLLFAAMANHGIACPREFEDALAAQVWTDEESMQLDLLLPELITELKDCSDEQVKSIVTEWWTNFDGESESALGAFFELRNICRMGVANSVDLLVLWGY